MLRQIKPLMRPDARVWYGRPKARKRKRGACCRMSLAGVRRQIPLAVISGPTFAKSWRRVCRQSRWPQPMRPLPTISSNCCTAEKSFSRLYPIRILSACNGAVKNVIAIGAGMSDGIGFGANARTALITRGLTKYVAAWRSGADPPQHGDGGQAIWC